MACVAGTTVTALTGGETGAFEEWQGRDSRPGSRLFPTVSASVRDAVAVRVRVCACFSV